MAPERLRPLVPSIDDGVSQYLPSAQSASSLFRSFGVTRESLAAYVSGTAQGLRREITGDPALTMWLDQIVDQSLKVTAGGSGAASPSETARQGALRVYEQSVDSVSLAHDVKNAGAAIKSLLFELQEEGVPSEAGAVSMREVLGEIKDLTELMMEATDEFRREAGGDSSIAREPLDVTRLVTPRKVASVLGAGVDVVFDIEEGLPAVSGSRAMLWRAVNNLLKNAREATENRETRRVTIAARSVRVGEGKGLPAGDYVRLTIRDTGAGIPEEKLDGLFEPFRSTKNDAGADGKSPLRGVGLWGTRDVARKHGGVLSVESEVGVGTAFHLQLPAAPKASLFEGVWENYKAGTHENVPILLVDDSHLLIILLVKYLKVLGYKNIRTADSAEMALEILEENPVALVVTDHNMEGMDGITMAEKIREARPGFPVILSSATSDLPFAENERSRRIKKPVVFPELARTVKELLTLTDAERGSDPR